MVRIAVVEDEAVSRQLLADYLARYSEENGALSRSPTSKTAARSSATTSRCTTSSSWTSR